MKQLIAFTENGKWGYKDKETNEILIPAKYDEINPSAEELSKEHLPVVYDNVQVKLNGKWGVRSVANEEILPTLYDDIQLKHCISMDYDFDYYIVKIDDKYGIINEKGETIAPIIYDEIDTHIHTNCVRQKDKWGVLRLDGEQILPVVFENIVVEDFLNSELKVTFRGKKGVVTQKGNILVPFDYDDVYTFSWVNTFGVKKNGKWQLVDRKNKPRNLQLYDTIRGELGSNIIFVMQEGKWGFLYENGQEATTLRVDDFKWNYPFLRIKINEKWGALNWKMEEIMPVRYDSLEIEPIELHNVGTDKAFGVVDQSGKIIIPQIYDFVGYFDRYANTKKLVGKKENEDDFIYIPPQFIEVAKNYKIGIFDILGNEKIPPMYDAFGSQWYDYIDEIIPAFLNGKWGYINMNNEVVVPFVYDEADVFWNASIAKVAIGEKYGLIDINGSVVYPPVCDWIWILDNNLIRIEQDGEAFHIDARGKVIERYDRNSLVHITTFLKEMGVELNQIIYEGGDGSSIENAIIIKNAATTRDGIQAEYTLIEKKYGEFKMIEQLMKPLKNKRYDIISFRCSSKDELIKIFFDITDFYGKH